MTRRDFIATTAGVALASVAPPIWAQAGRHALGLDNFAVRGMGWKAPQLIDYAASLKTDSLFITDFDAFESMDDAGASGHPEEGGRKELQIQLGTWSICPTSKAFRTKWGTADEHLALGIRIGQGARLAGAARRAGQRRGPEDRRRHRRHIEHA